MAGGLTDEQVALLATLITDPLVARQVVEEAGIPAGDVPWAAHNPRAFWIEVSRLLADGVIADGVSRLLAVVRDRDLSVPAATSDPLTAALAELAVAVRRQWAEEAALRGVRQPVPLRVRWSSTRRPVAAARDVVLDASDDSDGDGWESSPLTGDVEEIAAAFRCLPHRQLVVLGEPGAGKTVLAMELTLRLLEERMPADPVPVLVSAASWHPDVDHFETFLSRRLMEDYPFLGRLDARRGRDRLPFATQAVRRGRVLPIVDGLDELPGDGHVLAVERLDVYAAADRSLVVTCRGREYEDAVAAGGRILSRAAVVEIDPLGVEAAVAFLSHPAPSRRRWAPVFDRLRTDPEGPLAAVLSTPLMVGLARVAYQAPSVDPVELLDLPGRTAVTRLLIDGFLAHVYPPELPRPPDAPRSGLRRYRSDEAVRWLGGLAEQLYQRGSLDFWWWELAVVPTFDAGLGTRLRASARVLLTAVLVVAGAVGAAAAAIGGVGLAVRAAVVAAVVVSLSAAGAFRSMRLGGYVRPAMPGARRRLANRPRVRVVFGLLYGVAAGWLVGDELLGCVAGVVYGAVAAVMPTVAAPAGRRPRRNTPRLTLRANHRNATTAAIQYGLTGGALFAGVAAALPGPVATVAAGASAATVYALAAAYPAGLWTWTWFRLTHLDLALRGQLPPRLWSFLADAHSRGVLRQAGAAWQFRHAALQDHLTDRARTDHLRRRADAGDERAAERLANRLAGQGRVGDLRTRAEIGDVHAARRLADLLAARGQLDEAIALLRSHPTAGDQLSALLVRQGRVDEAVTLMTPYAGDDWYAAMVLANLLAAGGHLDGLAVRAGTDWYAAVRLAALLVKQGRADEAIRVLEPHAAADGDDTMSNADCRALLAHLLAGQGRIDDLRGRADRGDRTASRRLVGILARHGRLDELRTRADDGDPVAVRRLVDVLVVRGDIEEAISALTPHADDFHLGILLTDLLAGQHRAGELADRAEGGDRSAARRLVDLLAARGDVDELGSRADGGDTHAANRLLAVLAARSDVEQLRARADGGDHDAARRLADLLATQDRLGELRARADGGDAYAARRLAGQLAGQGRGNEAITVLTPHADDVEARATLTDLLANEGRMTQLTALADAGGDHAAHRLADLLAEQGRTSELRTRADAGDWPATTRLADLLAAQGRLDEAINLLRPHADRGERATFSETLGISDLLRQNGLASIADTVTVVERVADGTSQSADQLVEILTQHGRIDEAITLLRRAVDEHAPFALDRLVDFLAENGHIDDAIGQLRARADAFDLDATDKLAELLARHSALDNAVELLKPYADLGFVRSAVKLADLLARHGRTNDAITVLEPYADADYPDAARPLDDLLAKLGHADQLKARATAGDGHAAWRLANLLAEQGNIPDAIDLLARLADAGDQGAAERLADLLAEQGHEADLQARAATGDWPAAQRLTTLPGRARPGL
ncbi:effector-associated domain EAD1-containing protein [Frankia sp. CiP3]|uniref:effector-associated domain EAD1-containing protein n=1 Tax=Frankia sp. CiP3 TaxID=2880971 RepID=UPI001EF404E8|nr:effector-associated domain EAD1-containing protein [Frankia sp. CiP3]